MPYQNATSSKPIGFSCSAYHMSRFGLSSTLDMSNAHKKAKRILLTRRPALLPNGVCYENETHICILIKYIL